MGKSNKPMAAQPTALATPMAAHPDCARTIVDTKNTTASATYLATEATSIHECTRRGNVAGASSRLTRSTWSSIATSPTSRPTSSVKASVAIHTHTNARQATPRASTVIEHRNNVPRHATLAVTKHQPFTHRPPTYARRRYAIATSGGDAPLFITWPVHVYVQHITNNNTDVGTTAAPTPNAASPANMAYVAPPRNNAADSTAAQT
mmetsp:Transcript_17763/g.43705  ORF Transcript_17763/g.43705 Transcript_17763/m.43705 type:complete len:206 (+) Transcript_17763:318-935(+)